MEAAGSTAKKLIEGRDFAERISPFAAASSAPRFIFFRDEYVLRSVHIFVTAVMELSIDEIGAGSFYGSVDDRKIPSLAMKLDGLAEIVMWAVRHSRFS